MLYFFLNAVLGGGRGPNGPLHRAALPPLIKIRNDATGIGARVARTDPRCSAKLAPVLKRAKKKKKKIERGFARLSAGFFHESSLTCADVVGIDALVAAEAAATMAATTVAAGYDDRCDDGNNNIHVPGRMRKKPRRR